ncbi:MAG: hypothetical protein N4A35_16235 [Flavobacteriales bacterium]|jgi:hypothetical protein|nr:hypothetical protein [Flavobacteriales bacterium]
MKATLLFILVLLSVSCTIDKKKEEHAIKKTYEKYKTAILNKDGDTASSFLSISSLEYLDNIVYKALFLDSIELIEEPNINKLYILFARANSIDKDMRGNKLFSKMINLGFMESNGYANTSISHITFYSSSAKAQVTQNGKEKEGLILEYFKENKTWKLNLFSKKFLKNVNYLLDNLAKENEMDINDFLISAINFSLNKNINSKIWHPKYNLDS